MKKALALILSLALIFSSAINTTYATNSGVSVSAEGAVLIDALSGEILYEKNSQKRLGMASTTKIMTALCAVENLDINETITVSEDAVGIEGSSVYLYSGEKFTLEELLYALLLRSANDAAVAIAIGVGGSIENFSNMMNRKACEIGLKNTHFTNPHGLFDKDHYTSAYDLALITSHLLKNETLKNIVSTNKITIPFKEGGENTRLLVNHNKLLRTYDGAIGVKTGFTKATGRCLVSAAKRNGLTLIAVTLNAPDDWNDHRAMLDFGFDKYESVLIAGVGELEYSLPLVGGKESYLPLTNASELRVTVKKNTELPAPKIEVYHRFEFAPIFPRTELGEIYYIVNGYIAASSVLISSEYCEKRK